MINILVADFGGGTSDFSKLELNGSIKKDSDEVSWRFVGTAISGIQQFGGQDITQSIYNDLIKQVTDATVQSEKAELTKEDHKIMTEQLLVIAETAKKRLSLRKIWKGEFRWNRNKYLLKMNQARVKHLNQKHIKVIKEKIAECIQEDKIDELLMVGGSSEVPFIKQTLKEVVGTECNIQVIRQGRDLIAHGAAYIGQIIANKNLNIQFQQINAFDLGIGLDGGEIFI